MLVVIFLYLAPFFTLRRDRDGTDGRVLLGPGVGPCSELSTWLGPGEWVGSIGDVTLDLRASWSDTMFGEPGIDLGEDLEWIHRDQYVYYLEMAHALGDPTDWASFRSDLAAALGAAFSLYRTPPWADRRSTEDLRTRQQVLDVLDSVRFRHHPAGDWDSFFDALWERRSELRDDL